MTTPEQDIPLLGIPWAGSFWAGPPFFRGFSMTLPQPGPPVNGTEERLDLVLHELRSLRADLDATRAALAQQAAAARPLADPESVPLQEPAGATSEPDAPRRRRKVSP